MFCIDILNLKYNKYLLDITLSWYGFCLDFSVKLGSVLECVLRGVGPLDFDRI